MKIKIIPWLLTGFFLISSQVIASQQSWPAWLSDLRAEALIQGIRASVFDNAFRDVTPNKRVVKLDRSQPERRLTFYEYRKSRIDAYRIKLGVSEYKKNRALLEEVENSFGVEPCYILAIWGLETSYGRFMGSFSVIKALATLAYDGRRSAFFRKELLTALHIINDGHVAMDKLKGEWAGASGHPQFLPSSWLNYAVDFSGDGKRDIWTNKRDALASIANYLAKNGWEPGQPVAIPVSLPSDFDDNLKGKKNKRDLWEWVQMGITSANAHSLRGDRRPTSIITPYGGPDFLAFKNFQVIQSYNPSLFYVGSVKYLADQICAKVRN